MARTASTPDLELSHELAARGVSASPRQLERFRQAGLLVSRPQNGLGRGAGSRARRNADEVERAAYATELVNRHGSLPIAVLAMFGDGRYQVTKDRLEAAYVNAFACFRRSVASHSGAEDTRDRIVACANWLAGRAAKSRRFSAFRARLRDLADTGVREALERAGVDLLLITEAGRADSLYGLPEMLVTTGVSELSTATDEGVDPKTVSMLQPVLAELSLAALAGRVRASRLEELEQARDACLNLRASAQPIAHAMQREHGRRAAFPWWFLARLSDTMIAYATPGIAWLISEHGEQVFEVGQQLAKAAVELSVRNAVLDRLPDQFPTLSSSEDIASLSADQQGQLKAAIRATEKDHPEVVEAVLALV